MVRVPSEVRTQLTFSPQVPETRVPSSDCRENSSSGASSRIGSSSSGNSSTAGSSVSSAGASVGSFGSSSSVASVVSSAGSSSVGSVVSSWGSSSATSEASVTSSGSSPAPSAQTGVMSWKVMVRARNMANSFFMTVPSFRASPLGNGACFSFWGDSANVYSYFTSPRPKKQLTACIEHDDCMNAPPHAELLLVNFLSIENYFKEHSGAQADSKLLFLHRQLTL